MISTDLYPISLLTLWFAADSASQHLLTLGGFPEAVSVEVNTAASGDIRRPATEYGVTVVSPAVVDPILNTYKRKHLV